MNVLFVCLGNICRSPMAEGMLRNIVEENITVDSAGTGSWNLGQAPHHGTRKILDKYEIPYEQMFARQIKQDDFEKFDLIIAMDKNNLKDLRTLCPDKHKHKLKLFLDVLDKHQGEDVPDPWYTNDFDTTEKLVSQGCSAWKQFIEKGSL